MYFISRLSLHICPSAIVLVFFTFVTSLVILNVFSWYSLSDYCSVTSASCEEGTGADKFHCLQHLLPLDGLFPSASAMSFTVSSSHEGLKCSADVTL